MLKKKVLKNPVLIQLVLCNVLDVLFVLFGWLPYLI